METLAGERLSYSPLHSLRMQELAQLYAFYVQKYGENNCVCQEVLETINKLEAELKQAAEFPVFDPNDVRISQCKCYSGCNCDCGHG